MKYFVLLLLLAFLLVLGAYGSIILLLNQPPVPPADEYFVSKAGSNSNSCTQAQTLATAKLTIAAGLTCLEAGDTLTIKAGTYTEGINNFAIPSGIDDSNHTIVKAATGETVIVNGQTSSGVGTMIIYSRNFITIQGIIFDADNAAGHGVYIGRQNVASLPSTFIKMIDCEVKNANNSGIQIGYNQDGPIDSRFTLTNVTIHDVALGGTALSHALYITGQNNLVDGGEFYNAPGHGIHCYAHDVSGGNNGTIIRNVLAHDNGTSGIGVYDGTGMQVYNNIVYANSNASVTGAIRVGLRANSTAVYNNTSYSNGSGYGIEVVTGGSAIPVGTIIRNNIAYLNGGANIRNQGSGTLCSNNIGAACGGSSTVNPLFVDAPNEDFHLAVNSPAVGAGFDLSAVFTTDFDAATRTIPFDIGALELVPAESVTLFAPNGGENWVKTVLQTITWATSSITNVRIRADRGNDGTFEETISASTASDGSFDWTPGGTGNANVKIEICDAADNTPCAVSAAVFAITDSGASVVVTKRISDNTVGTKIGDIPGTSDGRIEQGNPTANFGGAVTLSVGKRTSTTHAHSIVGFPGLSQFTSNPAVTAVVSNVKVGLWLTSIAGTNTHTINFRKILASNIEYQRSWNNALTGVPWTTAGGIGAGTDRVSAISGQITSVGTAVNQYYEVNQSSGGLVDDVQDWIDDASTNRFWHLELDGAGNDNNSKGFQSKEGTNGQRPYLEVTATLTTSTITVSLPTDTHVFPGQILVVRWQSQGVSGNVQIELSRNNGSTYEIIASSIPVSNPDLGWVVSGPASTGCVVKITSLNNNAVFGLSPTFTIAGSRLLMR